MSVLSCSCLVPLDNDATSWYLSTDLDTSTVRLLFKSQPRTRRQILSHCSHSFTGRPENYVVLPKRKTNRLAVSRARNIGIMRMPPYSSSVFSRLSFYHRLLFFPSENVIRVLLFISQITDVTCPRRLRSTGALHFTTVFLSAISLIICLSLLSVGTTPDGLKCPTFLVAGNIGPFLLSSIYDCKCTIPASLSVKCARYRFQRKADRLLGWNGVKTCRALALYGGGHLGNWEINGPL